MKSWRQGHLPACYLLMLECSETRKDHLLICTVRWYIWDVCVGRDIYTCIHIPSSPYPVSRYMDIGVSFGKLPLKSYPLGFDQTQDSKISGECGWHLQEVFEIHLFKLLGDFTTIGKDMTVGYNDEGCQLLRGLVIFHWEGPLLFGENCHSKAIADKYLSSLEFILEFLSPSSWLDLNYLG